MCGQTNNNGRELQNITDDNPLRQIIIRSLLLSKSLVTPSIDLNGKYHLQTKQVTYQFSDKSQFWASTFQTLSIHPKRHGPYSRVGRGAAKLGKLCVFGSIHGEYWDGLFFSVYHAQRWIWKQYWKAKNITKFD